MLASKLGHSFKYLSQFTFLFPGHCNNKQSHFVPTWYTARCYSWFWCICQEESENYSYCQSCEESSSKWLQCDRPHKYKGKGELTSVVWSNFSQQQIVNAEIFLFACWCKICWIHSWNVTESKGSALLIPIPSTSHHHNLSCKDDCKLMLPFILCYYG